MDIFLVVLRRQLLLWCCLVCFSFGEMEHFEEFRKLKKYLQYGLKDCQTYLKLKVCVWVYM